MLDKAYLLRLHQYLCQHTEILGVIVFDYETFYPIAFYQSLTGCYVICVSNRGELIKLLGCPPYEG